MVRLLLHGALHKKRLPGKITSAISDIIFSDSYLVLFSYVSAYAFGSLKELFRDTIRLNTSFSSVVSLASTQKKPLRTNW